MTTEKRVAQAMEMMEMGYACSEAFLNVYCEAYGMAVSHATAVASGFAGGMGEKSGVCGVVSAAAMVAGLVAAFRGGAVAERRMRTAQWVEGFRTAFVGQHGETLCGPLNGGWDPATPQGRLSIRDTGKAPLLVASGIELLDDLLASDGHGV